MCAEWRHHHPGKFHCSRTEGKRRGTRPEKYVSFFTGSRNVAVLILCGFTFLEGNCYTFWSGDTDCCAAGIAGAEPQHHINGGLALDGRHRGRVVRALRRHRTLARQACPQGNADGLRPFGQNRACKQGQRYTSDITVWNVREVPVPVEPRFDPVIHEPMRLRICGILSTADCGVVTTRMTTRRRHAPPPASGRMSTPPPTAIRHSAFIVSPGAPAHPDSPA